MKSLWSFFDSTDKPLHPLLYDSGEDQDTIVQEVLEALDEHDIIFLQGGVGTGKSIIALHIIAYYVKGIIAVPTKALEDQYVRDYCGEDKNYLRDKDHNKLNVNNLRGRTNFTCPNPPPTTKTSPINCGDSSLYCTKRLKEGETRLSIAIECDYWSPIYPVDRTPVILERRRRTLYPYESVGGMRYYCESKTPCPYYHQFRHFIPSGAIIMNSMKWEAETWMLRKPRVAVEIIDEGDAFLDSITYKTSINRRTFQTLQRENLLTQQELDNLEAEYLRIFINHKSMEFELTSIPEILSFINFLADLLLESDSSVLMDLQYRLGIITQFKDYAWVHIENTEQSKTLTFYIPRMDITLDELRKRSGKLVFMSATSHSDENFRNIYNIMPKRVYAQERNPGTIYLMTPEVDRLLNVSDRTWRRKGFKEYYWDLLDDQLKVAARPCYVLVHARRYLPTYYQPVREEYGEKYWCRDGLEDVFFSTKMDRGIDLKDDLCRSIVLLKYPIPYLGDVVLKTIRKQYGESDFWKYVLDLANRELLQQCGRAVRNRDDWCEIYSPDQNVIYNLQNTWIGKLIEKTY